MLFLVSYLPLANCEIEGEMNDFREEKEKMCAVCASVFINQPTVVTYLFGIGQHTNHCICLTNWDNEKCLLVVQPSLGKTPTTGRLSCKILSFLPPYLTTLATDD